MKNDVLNLDLPYDKELYLKQVFDNLKEKEINSYKSYILKLTEHIYEVKNRHILTSEHLKTLEDGVRKSNVVIYFYEAGRFLIKLSNYFDNAKQLVVKLSEDKDFMIRYKVVTLMLLRPEEFISNKILIKRLNDKSFKVRLKSADVIMNLNKVHLINNLLKQIELESNLDKAKKLRFYYDLLLKGYVIEELSNNYYLQVKTKKGLIGKIIDKNQIENINYHIKEMNNL